ncbi:RNA-directed DNA polymerase from mobile element jockey-like [Elysia marginata]|uniref:RNA-directed DNA polymerase from mobile element jockey-like n=1 Tax=Elysia marginata TaxID=1093978 RepID=A0AAV4J0P0_9GAST|nr:RNA-directed DNA polymerase from mobile element jockey-like [Elysia marginata]
MYQAIKKFTADKRTSSGGCVKNMKGDRLFETEEIRKRWTEYVDDLFDDTRSELGVHSFLQGPDILPTEAESALHHMRSGKASGIDNISKKMLQAMGDFGINIETEICNKMYNNTHIPEAIRTSICILLPKKQRAVDCSDFRTISRMCHTLKLLLTIIIRRISDKINREVGSEQSGFWKNSGSREAIFCLKNLTEKFLETKRNIYTCFIDYSKVFDTVGHDKLIDILNKTDIDQNDLELIAKLYWNQKTGIRVNSEISTTVNIKRSVRQEGKVDGSRGRGRRRKSWTTNIAEMTNVPVNAAAKAAMEREGWRSMASNLFKEKEPS